MTDAPDEPPRPPVPPALKRFIWDIQSMVELADSEREILLIGRDLMTRLVAADDWLPAVFAIADSAGGRQFQLYSDGEERFAVACSVLSAGAGVSLAQPGVWEIVGVLRGAVTRRRGEDARALPAGAVEVFRSGGEEEIRLVDAGAEATIVVHVYGGTISKTIRRSIAPDGSLGAPVGYANGENAPPYDIFTIQTEIKD